MELSTSLAGSIAALHDSIIAAPALTGTSASCTEQHWIQLNLHGLYVLSHLRLFLGTGVYCGKQVEISTEGLEWVSVYEHPQSGDFGGNDTETGSVFHVGRYTRFVRVSVGRTLHSTLVEVHELQLFGCAAGVLS